MRREQRSPWRPLQGTTTYGAICFFDSARIPPGLPVIGISTPNGLVWVELTASEYTAAVADAEVARELAVYTSKVLARRLPKPEEQAIE
jgi:hypothetical protein